MSAIPATRGSQERRKNTPDDFIFGKLIGEGSFSSVFLVRENIATGRELACKVCDKRQIQKENKTKYILSEKVNWLNYLKSVGVTLELKGSLLDLK